MWILQVYILFGCKKSSPSLPMQYYGISAHPISARTFTQLWYKVDISTWIDPEWSILNYSEEVMHLPHPTEDKWLPRDTLALQRIAWLECFLTAVAVSSQGCGRDAGNDDWVDNGDKSNSVKKDRSRIEKILTGRPAAHRPWYYQTKLVPETLLYFEYSKYVVRRWVWVWIHMLYIVHV